ncbi:TetR family transcriptional regulator, partial [Streptomyces sp. NPDC057654]|uniref:TetR family transcriptional regulator n=1 Tax=Streptomyces sp. NPDC057654 TaxID=3346196 RepID=UPI0036A69677
MRGRSGRRPGKPDTRGAILAAAREIFAERGYDGSSIRHIAASAGGGPARGHHNIGHHEHHMKEVG